MLAQRVIAGAICVVGLAQMCLALFMPVHDHVVHFIIGAAYFGSSIAGFLVIRWDHRQACKECKGRL